MFLLWEENSAICQRYSGYIFQVFLAQSLFAAHLRGKDNTSDLSCPFFGFSFSFSLRLCRGFGTSRLYYIFPLARGKNRQHVPMSHEKTTYKATSLLLSPLKINKASKVSLLKRQNTRQNTCAYQNCHFQRNRQLFWFVEMMPTTPFQRSRPTKKTTAILRRDLWKWLLFWDCDIELHIQLSFFLKFQDEYVEFDVCNHIFFTNYKIIKLNI